MAGGGHSFQEILKVMSSMSTFETLLDATDLNAEICVQLGIHQHFKSLREKLAKYVTYDETKDLNLKCVCDLCYQEIKIFDFDLRSSLAIHNRGELHQIIAKNKEMNQNSRDVPSDFKKAQFQPAMERNNVTSGQNKLSSNENASFKDKHIGKKQNNLSDSKGQLACTCQRAFCICGSGAKRLPGLEEKLSNLNLYQLGIQQLVPLQLLQGVPSSQPQTVAPPTSKSSKGSRTSTQNKHKTNDKKEAPNSATPSQQSINIHLHMPTNAQQPQPRVPRSLASEAVTPRHISPNTRQVTAKNLERLRSRELGDRAETQLMFKMVKEAEGALWKHDNVSKDGDEYDCNICGSHMNSPYDLVKHVSGRTHQDTLGSERSRGHGNLLTEKNMEALRNGDLDEKAEAVLMWRMVKQAEGKAWTRDHITKVNCDEFHCNLCTTLLNSPHQLMQHVQGKGHQSQLKD